MTLFSSKDLSLENKLIGNILREYPQMSKIMQRYFGGHCLKRPGFKSRRSGWLAFCLASIRRGFFRSLRKSKLKGMGKN